MSIKINKCIKVTLNKCLNMDMKEIREIIKNANLCSCKASNKAMRLWLKFSEEENDLYESEILNNRDAYEEQIDKEYSKQKDNKKAKPRKYYEVKVYNKVKKKIRDEYDINVREKYGKTARNYIEGYMKPIMKDYNTSNVGTLHQQLVQNTWNRNKEDILNYKSSLPTFKENTPFFIKNDCYTLRNHNGYFVDISFFSKEGLKKYGYKSGHKFEFQIDKIDNNKKQTINKIINGEYKQGSAQISISQKGKIELIISFGFEKEENNNLNPNRILGIDLGITNVLTMSIYDKDTDSYEYINYKHNIINGNELIKFRQKLFNMGMSNKEIEKEIEKYNESLHQKQLNSLNIGVINGLILNKMRATTDKRKRDLSIASKYVGRGRCGHGYKTKMKPVNKIRNKVSDFADTFNHKYSKYVVEFALKNNCGVIQMEDLSGATINTKEKFLKDWSYYDLQQKIIYKGRENGIKVGKYVDKKTKKVIENYLVDPKYTSKRCNKCGNIHNDNRNCKDNQAKFKCVVCGHEDNADINASKNIAIPNIDKIIDAYIKETKKAS